MESDDELMASLAASGELREKVNDLDRRLRLLAGTVAEVSAKILASAPSLIARPWNWKEFSEQERTHALAELRAWMQTTLVRYPRTIHLLHPCWHEHAHALDGLTAAYGIWLLAMHGKANAEQFGYWLDRWLPMLDRILRESLGGCTRDHVPDEIELENLG